MFYQVMERLGADREVSTVYLMTCAVDTEVYFTSDGRAPDR